MISMKIHGRYSAWTQFALVALMMTTSCSTSGKFDTCPNGLQCPPGTTCVLELNICVSDTCGDGFVSPEHGEQCDSGTVASAECDVDCTYAECGDGVFNAMSGEQCDDAGDSQTCNSDCRIAECGDGFVNRQAGEVCDDGGTSAECDEDCTLAQCGDGVVNPAAGEDCETFGNTELCDGDCTSAECGDGFINPEAGEQCDDAGVSRTCNTDCTPALCGDGVVNIEADEECDDGNADDSDACLSNCRTAVCGDGFVHAGIEDCDDANADDDDECDSTCRARDPQKCSTSINCDIGVCVSGRCTGSIDAGGSHTCALLDTQAVRCWGHGGSGRLGYGNTSIIGNDEFPSVAGDVDVGSNVVQVATGGSHTCVLLDTGSVRCWGRNGYGQLGYGNTVWIGDDEAPSSAGDVDVGGTVVQITAGENHTCALLDSGAVRCWGRNGNGQLGYGHTDSIGNDETPASAGDVDVGGLVVQVAAGQEHTCALLDAGMVRCWGDGGHRLGYGHNNNIGDDETPASAGDVDVGGIVIQIALGDYQTCALLDTHSVRCWGYGSYDAPLGYPGTTNVPVPSVAGDIYVGGMVNQIVTGARYTCALLVGGTVRCWGGAWPWQKFGQLGYGNTDPIGYSGYPAGAGDIAIGGVAVEIAAGNSHTCARLQSGALRCWGYNYSGQLGYGHTGNIGDDELPISAGDVPYL